MAVLFETTDYKEFIRQQCALHADVRGYQGKMAEASGCPRSYFSRILNSKAQLSPEQAIRLAEFWHLRDHESEYFMELVNLRRTSLPLLIRRIRKRLKAIKFEAENLAKRFSEIKSLGRDREPYYYSSWYPAAVHVLIGIPGYGSPEKIASRLRMSPATVNDTLFVLKALGLARFDGKSWSRTSGHIHLSNESPMIGVHHSHWRTKAVEDSLVPENEGLHYTLVQSHALEAFDQIKQVFLASIDRARDIMRPSPNEDLTCVTLDFFRVL